MRSDKVLRPVLRGLSSIPWNAAYALSNVLAWMLQHLLRYRREVIDSNLLIAFPESTEAERKSWRSAFYSHFADLIVEMIKSLSIREAELRERLVLENRDLFEELYAENKAVLIVWGHYTNFELMAMGLPLLIPQKTHAVYQALRDPGFGALIVEIRQRFGLVLYEMAETYPYMLGNPDKRAAYIFMADQSPAANKIKFWGRFFGRPTATHLGVENLSKKLDAAVVWIDARRLSRGHYSLKAQLITSEPKTWVEGELTQKHLGLLEDEIKSDPPYWLWSHKRWKHSLPKPD